MKYKESFKKNSTMPFNESLDYCSVEQAMSESKRVCSILVHDNLTQIIPMDTAGLGIAYLDTANSKSTCTYEGDYMSVPHKFISESHRTL